LATTTLLK